MKRTIGTHVRSNLVGYLALFVALGSSTAWAASGPLAARNSVNSAAIVDGQVKRADLAANAITSAKVADGTLQKNDFARGTLLRGERGPTGPAGAQGPPGPAGGGSGGAPSGPAGGALKGTYPNPTLGPNTVGATEVADDSLTGADVNESTLAQVPSALLGGLGRWNVKHLADSGSTCTPTTSFGACADLTLTLPARARVLVLGRITGNSKSVGNPGDGRCRIRSTATAELLESTVALHSEDSSVWVHAPLMAVTPTIGPGEISFFLECRTYQPQSMRFIDAGLVVVALSAS